MKIGVLTSGGDCPGLNAVIRAITRKGADLGYEVVGILNGWKGLLTKIQPDGQVQDICVGTGIEDNIKFYYDRPTELNDLHGLGAVILAGTEMIKSEQMNK